MPDPTSLVHLETVPSAVVSVVQNDQQAALWVLTTRSDSSNLQVVFTCVLCTRDAYQVKAR